MFPSSVWLMKNERNEFLFEHMLRITQSMAAKIDDSMNGIFEHLQSHREWDALTAIANESVVARQDDDRVGLLQEKGLREVAEAEAKHESE